MSYEKGQDVIIVVLDIALTIFKGIKKLRGIIKKKAKKMPTISEQFKQSNYE
jgi:hypothetical protein